jgi:hypothetical protein
VLVRGVFVAAICVVASFGAAQDGPGDGPIVVDSHSFATWTDYLTSDYFQTHNKRCATEDPSLLPDWTEGSPADCTMASTTINPDYNPGDEWIIPVVVHVISNSSGTGDISEEMVASQIRVLNEDYLALPGTPGENGNYTGIRFVLAKVDPDGNPTNGIDRVTDDAYFTASYPGNTVKAALSWDTTRYLNLYTWQPSGGVLGWATFPQQSAGSPADGVVIHWRSFGSPSPGYPYHLGRTATHEVGHWLGLFHPFQDSCGMPDPPGCYTTGDRICDTPPDATQHFGCPTTTSCGSYPVPVENYMEYSDDSCFELFTPEQANRARCSLLNYRASLLWWAFSDGFDSGSTDEWTATQ